MITLDDLIEYEKENKENKSPIFNKITFDINIYNKSLSPNTLTFIYTNKAQIQKCVYSSPTKYNYLLETHHI